MKSQLQFYEEYKEKIRNAENRTKTIFIINLVGKNIIINYSPNDTILDLKKKYFQKEGLPTEYQRLIFGGRQLEDLQPISFYGITPDCTLHLMSRLKEGEQPKFLKIVKNLF